LVRPGSPNLPIEEPVAVHPANVVLEKEHAMAPRPVLKTTAETILVVDDNDLVLRTVVAILQSADFNVLSADSGPAALLLAAERDGTIDLLLSDIDMPGMSGPDLGEQLKRIRPHLHVMLMSGGENGNLLVLNYGWAYVQKPFVAAKLVEMVNHVLHSADRSQAGGQEFDSEKNAAGKSAA
jgi:DNA-binding NtrC family response regulator